MAPPTLTDQELSELERLAGLGLNQAQIADWFGFSERTLRRRLEHPDSVAAYKRGRSRAIAEVAAGLLQQALEGNLTAQIFFLKTKAFWRERDRADSDDVHDTARKIKRAVREMDDTIDPPPDED